MTDRCRRCLPLTTTADALPERLHTPQLHRGRSESGDTVVAYTAFSLAEPIARMAHVLSWPAAPGPWGPSAGDPVTLEEA